MWVMATPLARHGRKLVVGALFALASFSSAEASTELSELEIYKRCFMKLTRTVVGDTSPFVADVKAGKLTGATACLRLVQRAQFPAATGVLANPADEVAIDVIRTLHGLHRSWFQTPIVPNNATTFPLLADMEEPALYFTRAALKKNERFDSVVKSTTGLTGIRARPAADKISNFKAQRFFAYGGTMPYKDDPFFRLSYVDPTTRKTTHIAVPDSEITQSGSLVGVRNATPLVVPQTIMAGVQQEVGGELAAAMAKQKLNVDIRKHYGSGVIGSQSFMIMNANLGGRILPFEESKINRRLTARIYQDVLCHQLPTLTAADADLEVDPKSEHPFRALRTCMQCHSSIDPLAMAYKGFFHTITSGNPQVPAQVEGVPMIHAFVLAPVAGAKQFNLQAPTGRLKYREHITGKLVEQEVNGIGAIGPVLAQNKDLYTCAAKRYYQFFTGIDAPLMKLDPTLKNYEANKFHQDQVVELAETLERTQKVEEVFKLIFNSPAFKSRNYLSTIATEAE